MNFNESDSEIHELLGDTDESGASPPASEDELRSLAEDIVRYCPSLTHLLLALGSKGTTNPLHGMN